MKLADIAEKGNDLETLKQLRHKIAETIDDSKSGRDISSLARQLQIVMAQIAELEKEQDADDDAISEIIRQKRSQVVRRSNRRPSYDYDDDYDENVDG